MKGRLYSYSVTPKATAVLDKQKNKIKYIEILAIEAQPQNKEIKRCKHSVKNQPHLDMCPEQASWRLTLSPLLFRTLQANGIHDCHTTESALTLNV